MKTHQYKYKYNTVSTKNKSKRRYKDKTADNNTVILRSTVTNHWLLAVVERGTVERGTAHKVEGE